MSEIGPVGVPPPTVTPPEQTTTPPVANRASTPVRVPSGPPAPVVAPMLVDAAQLLAALEQLNLRLSDEQLRAVTVPARFMTHETPADPGAPPPSSADSRPVMTQPDSGATARPGTSPTSTPVPDDVVATPPPTTTGGSPTPVDADGVPQLPARLQPPPTAAQNAAPGAPAQQNPAVAQPTTTPQPGTASTSASTLNQSAQLSSPGVPTPGAPSTLATAAMTPGGGVFASSLVHSTAKAGTTWASTIELTTSHLGDRGLVFVAAQPGQTARVVMLNSDLSSLAGLTDRKLAKALSNELNAALAEAFKSDAPPKADVRVTRDGLVQITLSAARNASELLVAALSDNTGFALLAGRTTQAQAGDRLAALIRLLTGTSSDSSAPVGQQTTPTTTTTTPIAQQLVQQASTAAALPQRAPEGSLSQALANAVVDPLRLGQVGVTPAPTPGSREALGALGALSAGTQAAASTPTSGAAVPLAGAPGVPAQVGAVGVGDRSSAGGAGGSAQMSPWYVQAMIPVFVPPDAARPSTMRALLLVAACIALGIVGLGFEQGPTAVVALFVLVAAVGIVATLWLFTALERRSPFPTRRPPT